jgi:hypothetical protein
MDELFKTSECKEHCVVTTDVPICKLQSKCGFRMANIQSREVTLIAVFHQCS